uniref:Uncharacterized protein n=1 Tax=Sphaerodactylus townsendi TaxID=933632 RepID=A0ACB8E461_9SAUR
MTAEERWRGQAAFGQALPLPDGSQTQGGVSKPSQLPATCVKGQAVLIGVEQAFSSKSVNCTKQPPRILKLRLAQIISSTSFSSHPVLLTPFWEPTEQRSESYFL